MRCDERGTWFIEGEKLLGARRSDGRDSGVEVCGRCSLFLFGLLAGDLLKALPLLGPDVSLSM